MPDFTWPCDKRIAHGAHEFSVAIELGEWERRWCPGVPAHPNTMIGRAQ